MKKNKKIIVAVALAAVFAIAACVCVYLFLSPQRTTFYVFKEDYAIGTPITSTMFYPVQADSKIIVAGSAQNNGEYFITSENYIAMVQNAVLKQNVSKGEAFMTSQISTSNRNEVEIRMTPSAIAVTVPVTNVTGVTLDLTAESRINVYVTTNAGTTYLMLENVRVLATDRADAGLMSATLQLDTNQQATALINAINTSNVHFGLINIEGYVPAPADEPNAPDVPTEPDVNVEPEG